MGRDLSRSRRAEEREPVQKRAKAVDRNAVQGLVQRRDRPQEPTALVTGQKGSVRNEGGAHVPHHYPPTSGRRLDGLDGAVDLRGEPSEGP